MRAAPQLALALAMGLTLAAQNAGAQQSPPAAAQPAGRVVVAQLPFEGTATEDVRNDVWDSVRAQLNTRGATGPDRGAVQRATGLSTPSDTASLVELGRALGATHVLTGRVTPLTGQYSLELRLYEVGSQRQATAQRTIGDDAEAEALPAMLAALFDPSALQLSAEDRARVEAEQRARDEEARRQQEAQRTRDAQAARDAEARRAQDERARRDAAARAALAHPVGEGGRMAVSLLTLVGGRVTGLPTNPAPRNPQTVAASVRASFHYLAAPQLGPLALWVGGTTGAYLAPTGAFVIAPEARLALPRTGSLPLRASVGLAAGLFQGVTGTMATSFWGSVDARVEWQPVPAVSIFAGLGFEGVPGVMAVLGGQLGLSVHFGERIPNGSTPPAPAPAPDAPAPAPAPDAQPAPAP